MLGKFNRKKWKEEKETRKNGGSKLNFQKPKVGRSVWKLLPPWKDGEELPYCQHYIHFTVDSEGNQMVVKCLGKVCPICRAFFKLKDRGKEKRAQKYRRTTQIFYNAVNVETKELAVLQVGPEIQKQIDMELDEVTEDPFDLTNNLVFVVKRAGKGLDTKYQVRIKKIKADTDFDAMNLPESVSNLKEIYDGVTHDTDTLKKLLKGELSKSDLVKAASSDDDDDDFEEPVQKKNDNDDLDFEDDDEVEEEAPKKKKAAKTTKANKESDLDDDDLFDDEPEAVEDDDIDF